MNSGFYAACAGLQAQTQALELVANNVANLNTTGYRAQQPIFRSLLTGAGPESGDPLNRVINDFSVLSGSRTDLMSGNLERTGNPLDLAIEGSGFFAIQTPQGTLYTRNGNFQVSAHGQLTTNSGDAVLGDQGPVTLPSGAITISPDGTISVEGAVAGKLQMVEFAPGTPLTAVGNAYYSAPSQAAQPAAESSLHQGMLESSNVDSVRAVVDMITVERHAEMLERALGLYYSNFDHTATSDLPKV
jgi:flagellar basal-body rod protein FlgF